MIFFFFSSRRRHTRWTGDWSSDVCSSDLERERRRLEVKPGLTGWAQVNGRAGIPWAERIELDVWYVDHRSAALDLRILARSVRLLLSGRGLSPPGEGLKVPAAWEEAA